MREFEFLEPTSVQEASQLLREHGDDCRIIAGGTALMLALRQRMLMPSHVISIAKIRALRGITLGRQGELRIGALTLHAEIARSPLIREQVPMLADMASRVANPQVRNQGTIGGNLCYADPATDPPTCLMALDAQVVLKSASSSRILSIQEFLVDYYTTALEPGELVTEIRVPAPQFDRGYHSRFLRKAAEHRPMVTIAMTVKQQGDVCEQARVVVGASTTTPTRVKRAEDFLTGKPITKHIAAQAADIAADEIDPVSDLRGTADYRRQMVRIVARRTMESLFRLEECSEESVG